MLLIVLKCLLGLSKTFIVIVRMTIDHFWDSIVTIGNLPIRKSGAMTSILRDAMKGMNDNHDES